jgi:hypothetical protein
MNSVCADFMTERKYRLSKKSVQQSNGDLIAFRLCTAANINKPRRDGLRDKGFSALG